jgi:hypothetical protein
LFLPCKRVPTLPLSSSTTAAAPGAAGGIHDTGRYSSTALWTGGLSRREVSTSRPALAGKAKAQNCEKLSEDGRGRYGASRSRLADGVGRQPDR